MDRVKIFVETLKKEPLVKKHLLKYPWLSGCSTEVAPITVWNESIVLQWDTTSRRFNRFISRMAAKFPDVVDHGYFSRGDGSSPAAITFILRKEAFYA